ncbi:hypothetical protein LSH36_445g02080 [Paralvinella palmiformis]|uniref:Transmembrane protein 39A n=1 Tax=Paralvinella palmiformis TaxID=53620 RepID=A0AAD9JC72_9ANNE|nr:hypothetical protein LSH36_445g02080 [Paralvinella palmiformis]
MPAVRRNFQRGQGSSSFPSAGRQRNDVSSCAQDDGDAGSPLASIVVQPHHSHIPDIAPDSNLIFEGMVFMYSVMTLCLQYINLYKTVWWLPHSNAKYALNFYLIDPHLSLLLIIIISRRVIYCFVSEVFCSKSWSTILYWLIQLVKTIIIGVVLAVFLYTAYKVVLRHSLLHSLFLCYPMLTYIVLFRYSIRPLFGKTIHCTKSLVTTTSTGTSTGSSSSPTTPSHSATNGTPKHRQKEQIMVYSRNIPVHSCTMSPEAVRDEVEALKTDFNNRIKQVLFNSLISAYYMGFVPLCFAQNTLYYDTWWVGQHICLVWISTFIMFMVHFLPAKYIDVLHRCALHLGSWMKVEVRHAHKPYSAWSELQVWQQGALVKHVRGLFKAEGVNNSAEPGNSMHSRFNFMFYQPLRVTNWLTMLTVILIGYQFVLLLQATEWSHVLSLALMLFCNYYMLFKLLRDKFVLIRAYKEETNGLHIQ